MNMPEAPYSNFSGEVAVCGEDLFRIAEMLSQKIGLLDNLKQRERIRKDRRLESHGIGFHQGVAQHIDKNWRLVVFLTDAAIKAGCLRAEAFLLLARGLYAIGEYAKALETIGQAGARNLSSPALSELQLNALLESGDHQAVQELLAQGDSRRESLGFIATSDYAEFDRWCADVGAEMVTVNSEIVEAKGTLRYRTGGQAIDFENTLTSTPLVAAKVHGLDVLSGVVPFAKGAGYYDHFLLGHRKQFSTALGVSKTQVVYDADSALRHEFPGRHIITCAAIQYYGNYFHAICQIACRLYMALRSGDLGECGILLPECAPAWLARFLSILGVREDQIRFMPSQGVSHVEEAYVLPMKWDICPAEIRLVRQRLAEVLAPPAQRTNYYLLRNNVQHMTRSLINEEQFIQVCRERGFTVIDPLDYSLPEQIELFKGAGIIVTSASSAYTNMLFASQDIDVVIVMPRLFWGMLSADLATACGHTLTTILGEFVAGNNNVSDPHHPYSADPELLRAHLDGLLARQAKDS